MIGDKLLENNPLVIADIGASGGVDPRWLKFTTSYKGVLFEPDPREYDSLKNKSDNNLIVINSALSDSNKTIDFHLTKEQQKSSAFLPNIDLLSVFPESDRYHVVKDISIETDTLDSQLKKNNVKDIDFIKIDTQGYELSILKGSVDSLEAVIGLELEVEFVELYKNQPLFGDVDKFVQEKGFELYDLRRYHWRRDEAIVVDNQKGQLIFGDALYFKSPESIVSMANISEEKIIRSMGVYLAYGYFDLAHTLLRIANEKGLITQEKYIIGNETLLNFKKRYLIPQFKGKAKIWSLLQKIAKSFNTTWYAGTDHYLGNP